MSYKTKDFLIDDACSVIEPNLHDSHLVRMDLEREIRFYFKLTTSEIVSLTMHGVEQFVCNGLRSGNIVLDVTLCTGEPMKKTEEEQLFEIGNFFNPKFKEYLSVLNSRLQKSELVLVSLNPSYGCNCVAICERISFERNVKWDGGI